MLAANRRNARKSTGPRTERGKAQSRLNSLRTGERSPVCEHLFRALVIAPPGCVDQIASELLSPETAANPVFAKILQGFRDLETDDPGS